MSANQSALDYEPVSCAPGGAAGAESTTAPASERPSAGAALQIGITVDHRRLFGALQDGWLRPLEGRGGHVLGVGRFPTEIPPPAAGHRVAVRLALNKAQLPDLAVLVLRAGLWRPDRLSGLCDSDEAVHLPGAIPAFAIASLAVSSAEERARLVGLSRAASNLGLSDMRIDVAGMHDDGPVAGDHPAGCGPEAGLVVPPTQDAVHGALTMAVRTVPRIEPWLDVLQESLAAEPSGLATAAAAVDAAWWRSPPWRRQCERPETLADCLWFAVVGVFRNDCQERSTTFPALLEQVAECAMEHGGDGFGDAIPAWREDTERLLRAETTLKLQGWRRNPVGLALQLVLARPSPGGFMTWFKAKPALPPAVAWSAATLCGLLNGYRRLATDLRGSALQREVLAIAALSFCDPRAPEVRWPMGRPDLRWHKRADGFVLAHKGREVVRTGCHARGQWYSADLGDAETLRAAEDAAATLGWPCYRSRVEDAEVPWAGPGAIEVRSSHLAVHGSVELRVPRPAFDIECFRRLVATEAGEMPRPPVAKTHAEPPAAAVPGLVYQQDFVDEEHERRLAEWIDQQPWRTELSRRVQHYGWRYSYRGKRVDPSMRLGALPAELADLAQRLVDEGLLPQLPDQVIVNEYNAGQGISPHVDAPSFDDGIATLSLLDSWEMVFHPPAKNAPTSSGPASGKPVGLGKVPKLLERRSVAVMHGEARHEWKHEIAKRKREPAICGKRKWRQRSRRLSLTFRKVRPVP